MIYNKLIEFEVFWNEERDKIFLICDHSLHRNSPLKTLNLVVVTWQIVKKFIWYE